MACRSRLESQRHVGGKDDRSCDVTQTESHEPLLRDIYFLFVQVFIPITELVENSPRCLNVHGRTWERVLTITRQPSTTESHASLEKRVSTLKI